jgi:hypothetical protein
MYIQNFLLRMTDNMTSQNIDLSSSDTPYAPIYRPILGRRMNKIVKFMIF